jgi:hypothetical protein
MPQAKPKSEPKATPGLVSIRLQLTPDERDRLRVIAAEDKTNMAIWCQRLVRAAIKSRD